MPALRNPKHEAFCREVAGGVSAERAWASAGNNPAANNAARLMRQPKIVARIDELRKEFNQQSGLHLRYLQEKLLPLATSDVTAYFEADDGGKLKLRDVTKLPPEIRSALSEMRIDADGNLTVKTWNKNDALKTLLGTIGGFAPTKIQMVDEQLSGSMGPSDVMRRTVFSVRALLAELDRDPQLRDHAIRAIRLMIDGRDGPDRLKDATSVDQSLAFARQAVGALGHCCRRVIADRDGASATFFVDALRQLAGAVEQETRAALKEESRGQDREQRDVGSDEKPPEDSTRAAEQVGP